MSQGDHPTRQSIWTLGTVSPPGERVGNRISANAVNAEVISSRGKNLPVSKQAPREEMRRAGATGSRWNLPRPRSQCAPEGRGWETEAGTVDRGRDRNRWPLTGAGTEGGKEPSDPWVIPSEGQTPHRHPERRPAGPESRDLPSPHSGAGPGRSLRSIADAPSVGMTWKDEKGTLICSIGAVDRDRSRPANADAPSRERPNPPTGRVSLFPRSPGRRFQGADVAGRGETDTPRRARRPSSVGREP